MNNPTWDEFAGKNAGRKNDAFEALARLLFRTRYGLGDSIPYFKNHSGNETATIKCGNEVIGFQAKFFEDGKINPDEILKSLVKVEKGQTIQIIYTNSAWGNPKRGKDKTEGQIRIEKKAKEINIKIEWLYGNDVLDLSQKNQLAYDVFFNLNSNLHHLQENINSANELWQESIGTSFMVDNKRVSIDRSDFVDQLAELIVGQKNVVITGESGTGKSAIVKMYYDRYRNNNDYTFYIINAAQLNTKAVNDLFSLQENYTLTGFRDYFKGTAHKILVIDSAEKITELTNKKPLSFLINELNKEGWNFVFTCCDNAQKELIELLGKEYSLTVNVISVNIIGDEELKRLGIILPQDRKLLRQIHIPFYLARYCEQSVAGRLDLKSFKESVWQQKVLGDGSKAQQYKREHCLLEIVRIQQESGVFYIDYYEDYESAMDLTRADILCEERHKGFFIKHDIYADWALDYILYKELSDKNKVLNMLNSDKPSFRYVNAFKRWYAECLNEKTADVSYIGEAVFNSHLHERWRDAIMECIGSSADYALHWFGRHAKELEADDFNLFNHFVDILCVSCKSVWTTFKYEGIEYPVTQPVGSGWEEVAKFINQHIDGYYMNHLGTVYNFLSDFYGYKNAKGEKVELGGKLALHIFQTMAEKRLNGKHTWMERGNKWSQLVCQYALENRIALQQIFDEVVEKQWTNYDDPYRELVEYIVKSSSLNNILNISLCCYPQIVRLLDTFWREQPEEDKDGLFPYHRHIRREYMKCEEAFGLNNEFEGANAYFPSSALQTPLLSLLNAELFIKNSNDVTLEFIIRFMNDAVEKFSKSNYAGVETETISVTLNDGTRHDVIACDPLWCLYRATSDLAMPNMLECMHMALESFLLTHLEDKNEKENVNNIHELLWKILNQSQSASLYAVVASVAMSNIDEFTDILLFLMQDIRFLRMDLHRHTREFHAHSLSFAYYRHKRLWEERKKANEMKHRQEHLEEILLKMQVSTSNRDDENSKHLFAKCQEVVKKLKEQVAAIPEEKLSFENFIIARIDYTSMRKEVVTLKNGQKAIQITPTLTPEMEKNSRQILEASNIFMRGANLRFWVNKRNEGDFEAIKNNPYEKNSSLVLETIHELMSQMDDEGLPINNDIGDEFLPGMASSVLLMQLADKLSEEEKRECREYLFEALSHPEFQVSSSLSDFKEPLQGFPALLDMTDKRSQLQDILIGYAEIHDATADSRPCDNVSFMIDKYRLWEDHGDFMNETLAKYQQKLPDGDFNAMDSDQAVTVLSLLTVTPKDRRLGNLCIEKISALWRPNEHSHYRHVEATFLDSYIVAEYILRSPANEVRQLIAPFLPYIKGHLDYDSFIPAFVTQTTQLEAYDNFWIVWDALYDNIVKAGNINRHYNSQTLNNYMINPSYLTEIGKDWFHLEEKDVAFYARIAQDLPHSYTPLYAISRVFTSIGEQYVKQIIPVIASLVDGFTFREEKMAESIIFNLEKMMVNLFENGTDEINRDKDLHDLVVTILEFMKNNRSSRALDYLKLV